MAHVATGAYSRPGDYERAYNRDVQASALYRESNSQLDYFSRPPEAIHSNSSTRPPNGAISEAHYFPSIATGIGPLSNRLSALELAEQAGLGRPSSPTNNLRKAMKAVEEAESAIMEQMQENEQLRNELQLTTWELQNYKPEGAPALRQPEENLHHVAQKVEVPPPTEKNGLEDSGGVSIVNREKWVANGSQGDLEGTLVVHRNLPPEYNNHVSPPPTALSASQNHSSSNTLNGNPRGLISGQPGADCTSFSQISSPSSRSVSPNRYHREGDFDSRPPLSGQGLMQAPEIGNQSSLWKQDLFLRARAQEEDILQLRKRLADNAIKELKLLNEKHVLEKRIAGMRMAFDQQQQDLVDAASKALSYRHDIMEENIRLTYALQAAQQERSVFVSSLLPLLAEYDFQPPVTDAHSIVSNVKVLIQHLHEKLNLSEAKLKDSQYHLTAWRADPVYQSPYAPQSPFHPNGDHSYPSLNANGLEIVPQPSYSQGQMPASPPTRNLNTGADWDPMGVKYQNLGMSSDVYHGVNNDRLRQSPFAANEAFEPQVPANVPLTAQSELPTMFTRDEESAGHAPVNDSCSDSEIHETMGNGSKEQTGRDAAGRSPYLPTLPEEPNSSVSEEDDPLPAVDNLQIVGEAAPGGTLQACGFQINGTSVCLFQWVRHFQDGTMRYIEGEAQPEYTVTADDVDTLIAIECHPMDERKRQGKMVKVFANDQNKITCDPIMQEQIETYLHAGQAIFEILLLVNGDTWEEATLTLKRATYEIKSNKQRRVIITEKYTSNVSITIPCGYSAQCVLTSSEGTVYALSTHEENRLRDTLALTMRRFQKQALEKRRGKMKVPFFNRIVNG